jgi:glycosyltransferase involved in cell wall biosynthesis
MVFCKVLHSFILLRRVILNMNNVLLPDRMELARQSHRSLRILLVAPGAPPMGGIARYAQDMMNSELARLHEITYFNDKIPFKLRPRAVTEKHTWNIVKRDGLWATVKVLAFVAKCTISLERAISRGHFDVMHVLSTAGYGFFRNSVHIVIAKRWGVKTIFHLLGQIDDLYREAGPRLRWLISHCLDIADVHIVQSPGLAQFMRGITKRPVYSIFNGVRPEEFMPPDGYAHSSGDGIKVISVGQLGHRKGTFDLLDVAERLQDKWPTMEFIFIGGGEVERFRQMAAKRALSNVRFLGTVDDELRTRMLQTSDIFVLPSHAEGQPIALLEAMAAGLPVISSTVGSIPEVVREQNGFLVRPGDVDAIVKHLEMLAADARLREEIGRFNAQEARVKYRLERVMREIDAVYAVLFG